MSGVEMVRLGDVAELIAGAGFPLTYQGEVNGDLPFAKVGDISRVARVGGIIAEAQHYVSFDVARKLKAKVIPTGSIVFAKIGEAIRQNFKVMTGCELLVDNNAMGIVPDKNKVDSCYLLAVLKTIDFYRLASATTVPSLRKSDLENLLIPLPPLERQREIAAVLDKVDDLRAKRRQSISKLEELLQSTFLEMFGDPVENPKGWEVKKLGEVADVVSGVTKGKKYKDAELVELPYMRVANVQDGKIDLSEVKTVAVSRAEAERYRLLPGDVLLTEGGDPDKLGRGAVWHGEVAECIHQNHIFCFLGQADLLRPEYLSSLIGSAYGKNYFLRMAKQTTGIASINMTQLKGFPVQVPPLELQDRLSKVYSTRIKTLEKYSAHLAQLNTLYSSLQAQFFGAGA